MFRTSFVAISLVVFTGQAFAHEQAAAPQVVEVTSQKLTLATTAGPMRIQEWRNRYLYLVPSDRDSRFDGADINASEWSGNADGPVASEHSGD